MGDFIKRFDNKNNPIVDSSGKSLDLTYFNLIRLKLGESYQTYIDNYETVWVVMYGNCNINISGKEFKNIGKRQDIWSGKA